MTIFRDYLKIDLRVMAKCVKRIQRHRMSKFLITLNDSIIADGIDPTKLDEHDKMFEPIDRYEQEFWQSCRERAKKDMRIMVNRIEIGKRGGRPKKIIDSEKEK
ncbi:MAG: hypothetical protein IKT32_04820 [Clostridia bacterium]|nr:hypothetical protein [Clostridia bacterium]